LSLIEKLKEEEKKQEEHVKLVISRLKKEKDTWFSLSECHCLVKNKVSVI